MISQGEIWLVNFDPTQGREQSGTRPAVVISGDMLNQSFPLSIVCPLTTSYKEFDGNVKLNPTQMNGLKGQSQVLTLHIKSISNTRFIKKIGNITNSELDHILQNVDKLLRY